MLRIPQGRQFFTSVCHNSQKSRLIHTSKHSPSICIVGSGPAGFYTADSILKNHATARVCILDKLPTPYGLVRYGVAPDHPEVKSVTNKFESVASDPRCTFLGNLSLEGPGGAATSSTPCVSLPDLRKHFDAVVLAYGASSERSLGIEGEDRLGGIFGARKFVGWYNGHPMDYEPAPPANKEVLSPSDGFAHWLSRSDSDTAVVVGQGNVALDISRILLKPLSSLGDTDVTAHAFSALARSNIKRVVVIGRRGPAQVAFTTKEFRELTSIEGLALAARKDEIELNKESQKEVESERAKKRLHELFSKSIVTTTPTNSKKTLEFRFLQTPVRFVGDSQGRVTGLVVHRNKLTGEAGSQSPVAANPAEEETIPCGLVLRSIGYKSVPVSGVPFDSRRGIVPNDGIGRVVKEDGSLLEGVYVSGWLKRGPSGIILTNMVCAQETAAAVLHDIAHRHSMTGELSGAAGLTAELDASGKRQYVTWEEYKRLDEEEVRRGREKGKPREKVASVEEMLKICKGH